MLGLVRTEAQRPAPRTSATRGGITMVKYWFRYRSIRRQVKANLSR